MSKYLQLNVKDLMKEIVLDKTHEIFYFKLKILLVKENKREPRAMYIKICGIISLILTCPILIMFPGK